MNLDTIPPMPATNCPTWCNEAHAADWAREVALGTMRIDIPMTDGTVTQTEPKTAEQLSASWKPFHLLRLVTVDIGRARPIVVDLMDDGDGPQLYIDAEEGTITPEQMRTLSAALLKAVEVYEGLKF